MNQETSQEQPLDLTDKEIITDDENLNLKEDEMVQNKVLSSPIINKEPVADHPSPVELKEYETKENKAKETEIKETESTNVLTELPSIESSIQQMEVEPQTIESHTLQTMELDTQPNETITVPPTDPIENEERLFEEETKKTILSFREKCRQKERIIFDPTSPYYGINIEDFWGVIERPQDIHHMPAAIHTLLCNKLSHYGAMLMTIIEYEKKSNQWLTKLGNILLEDDPFLDDFKLSENVEETLITESKQLLFENLANSSEYLNRIGMIRTRVMETHFKKQKLSESLLAPNED